MLPRSDVIKNPHLRKYIVRSSYRTFLKQKKKFSDQYIQNFLAQEAVKFKE
jgi:alpha-D-ribose 1-methylphosphonate 5-triphosphate diphosphatase PhnM